MNQGVILNNFCTTIFESQNPNHHIYSNPTGTHYILITFRLLQLGANIMVVLM